MSNDTREGLTRRHALAAATVAGGVAVASAAAGIAGSPASAAGTGTGTGSGHASTPRAGRMPTLYLPHGGGPWPFVSMPFGERSENEALLAYLRAVPSQTPVQPRALLVVSAHWEEPVPTVMSGPNPPMLYDYYGFPPESYAITWPAPGHPELAARVRALLEGGGFSTGANTERGYDHGTFVPLKVSYPDAQIPVVQLSLKRGLDPAEHLAMGRALAPLRDDGVFIVGSGMSYHNMRGFMGGGRAVSETFDAWLRDAATAEPAQRAQLLSQWASAPAARQAHPREEHLLPLMVVAGAAGEDRGRTAYSQSYAGVRISAFQYG